MEGSDPAETFANRDDPIPIFTFPGVNSQDPPARSSDVQASESKRASLRQKLHGSVLPSKGDTEDALNDSSIKSSLQDRLLAK